MITLIIQIIALIVIWLDCGNTAPTGLALIGCIMTTAFMGYKEDRTK